MLPRLSQAASFNFEVASGSAFGRRLGFIRLLKYRQMTAFGVFAPDAVCATRYRWRRTPAIH